MVERSVAAPWSRRWRPWIRVGAVVAPVLTGAVLGALGDGVTSAAAALILVLWVVAAASTGDRVAGVLAALAGAASFDFFLTEPRHRFTISSTDDVETTVLLVVISLAVSEIALWGYRQQRAAQRRAGYLDGVLDAARSVAEGHLPTEALVDVVARQVADVLGADDCRFVEGPVHDARVAVLDQDGGLTRGGRLVDVARTGLPTDEYVAVPVRRGDRVVGHFLVTATTRVSYPSAEQLRVAVLLADQVAPALPA
ncbi:DUF4118 domain-containing protein [Nocardioides sp.]|uniref:DUF4118 domain-containing protein n=1 Tax=Nocardioides sp. TaxID=35761 RepID=UPI00378480FA